MRIGILGEAKEAEVQLVADRLRELGAEPVIADLSTFPKERRVAVEANDDTLRVLVDGEDVGDVGAWYVRRYGFVDPLIRGAPPTEDEWRGMYPKLREWWAAEGEKAAYVSTLLRFLAERSAVVNPPEAFIGHHRKLHQVYQLVNAGLPVPPFTYGNDPDAIRRFMKDHERVVYKPVSGERHVFELKPDVFEQRTSALRTEPICVQALAEGEHVRAYVVGDRLVGAAAIRFDRAKGVDYRASQEGADVIDLPEPVKADCVKAAAACGMPFTGLDVIVDRDAATHFFLECNPSPMFANYERHTGVPVSRALAEHLLALAKR